MRRNLSVATKNGLQQRIMTENVLFLRQHRENKPLIFNMLITLDEFQYDYKVILLYTKREVGCR